MNKTKKEEKKRDKNVLKFYQNYTYKKEQLEEKEKRRNTNIIYYTKINIIFYQFLHRIKPKILKNKNAHKDE